MSEAISPFRVEIPQSALDDLDDRLARTRWPDEIPGVGWSYGIPASYLKELAEYWRTSYDWRAEEALLNRFPQFTTTIDGQNVHFLHVRSANADAIPLVLTHGWPGSIAEFLDIIEPLTNPASGQAFHVVIPSIPGFGFSGPTTETGWDLNRIARAWAELMRRLGYERYAAQGGDWGSGISRTLASIAPANVIGVHLNMLFTFGKPESAEEAAVLAKNERYTRELAGYMQLQSTRPQTHSFGLADSPVGQLAWIVERFKDWTDSTDRPEDAVDRDRMLTTVMLYWLTNTAASSSRIYKEASANFGRPIEVKVPVGVALFEHDIAHPVRRLAEQSNNIVRWTEFERGGHFAAMEQPDVLVEDIRAFFSDLT